MCGECDKKALRKYFSELRARTSREGAAERALETFLRSPYSAAKRVFVYHAVGTEMETQGIVTALLAAGKHVCLPRIVGGEMIAAPYGKLVTGKYGIPAPETGEDTPCDLVLTPLLAVDAEGFRLGYGGGYYDGYFARHRDAMRVGLCFEAQRTDKLPHAPHDVPLHAVITECGLVRFGA